MGFRLSLLPLGNSQTPEAGSLSQAVKRGQVQVTDDMIEGQKRLHPELKAISLVMAKSGF